MGSHIHRDEANSELANAVAAARDAFLASIEASSLDGAPLVFLFSIGCKGAYPQEALVVVGFRNVEAAEAATPIFDLGQNAFSAAAEAVGASVEIRPVPSTDPRNN